jgi:hypothetical protein
MVFAHLNNATYEGEWEMDLVCVFFCICICVVWERLITII